MLRAPDEPPDPVVPPDPPSPPGEVDFATYVAIEAALAEDGGPLGLLLAEHDIESAADYDRAREKHGRTRAKSPEAEAGYQRMLAYFIADHRARKEEREAARRAEEAEQRAALAAQERAIGALPIAPPAEEPAAPPPRKRLDSTALSVDVPRGPALPFAAAPPPPEAPAAPAASEPVALKAAPSEPAEPRPALTGTALSLDRPSSLPLPFSARASIEPAANTPPAQPPASINRPAAKLAGTLPLGHGPMPIPPMPFQKGESALATAPRAEPPPRPAIDLGGTVHGAEAPRLPVIPFEAARAAPPKESAPRLTLEQHASLCAELAFYAGHEAAVLARHTLDAAAKSALDDHYRGVVQASPEARLAWNRTFQAYSSWLAKRR
ncbi:MAG: hypothetical protein U0359_12315 [Byssovorax sp.]